MGFEWSTDVSRGDWIRSRLLPWAFPMQPGSTVPTGFAAYCRMLHPAYGLQDLRVRWREISAWADTELTPHAPYGSVSMLEHIPDTPSPACGGDPQVGSMDLRDFNALADILSHGDPYQETWWAVWDGHGWDRVSMGGVPGEWHLVPDPVPATVRKGPRLQLPYRDYLLARGTTADAMEFARQLDQTPNLWWASDQSWCVATEIDFNFTYVGGPKPLIEKIVASELLEALPVLADDAPAPPTRPAWLEEKLDQAVHLLLTTGRAEISTGQGMVRAGLTLHNNCGGTLTWRANLMWRAEHHIRDALALHAESPEAFENKLRHELWQAVDCLAGDRG